MLMRTDPFRELDRFHRRGLRATGRPLVMPIDAYREGDNFYVHFDLPGIDIDSIDLTVRAARAHRARRASTQGGSGRAAGHRAPSGCLYTSGCSLGTPWTSTASKPTTRPES
jgi:HSP20 family protein